MDEIVVQLQTAMLAASWSEIGEKAALTDAGLMACYCCDFAVAGFSYLHAEGNDLARWHEQQALIGYLRNTIDPNDIMDAYLVFIVDNVSTELSENLGSAINDEHVCHKMCVELAGRDIREVLAELPFLGDMKPKQAPGYRDIEGESGYIQLPSSLLDDLSRRSAVAILDELLREGYTENEGLNHAD